MNKYTIRNRMYSVIVLFLTFALNGYANRQVQSLNLGWKFRFGYEVRKNVSEDINLPHTWNTKDALGGNTDYYRGIGVYTKELEIKNEWEGKRLFVRFLGANSIANVFINGKHVGEHRGGYTAFTFEISSFVKHGAKNTITVKVNNAPQLDIMPLVGDFNFYGGLYRDVDLYVCEHDCISLLDYGSKGVYVFQDEVNEQNATVRTKIKLLGKNDVSVKLTVLDALGKEVLSKSQVTSGGQDVEIPFEIRNPHLWNSTADAYLYSVKVQLFRGSNVVDEVLQPLGLRYYNVDPNDGVSLNGKHIQLKGVCRHQDRPEIGNALNKFHHAEDVSIMMEMGANALRMSHYPHDPYMYELCDKKGIMVWCEIPFVGPGGYADKGFVDMESFKENGRQQLIEMIRQNMNHPSILFWGLFNELKESGDNPVEYVRELDRLAKNEDPTRITTAASNQSGLLNEITNLIAWNTYYGWYGGNFAGIGKWADAVHAKMPNTPIGISEYGAGASVNHQQEELTKSVANSYWHPENWQTAYHEVHWEEINKRPFLWGTFIWNLFDFGAAHRTEGEVPGKNDKGLVSFDRNVKKDAFYFYKANWNKEKPMVYIAERRIVERKKSEQTIKVYSNQDSVELWVNGTKYSTSSNANLSRFYFDVKLNKGENIIVAKSGNTLQDRTVLNLID
ncbi:MAG: glycoside hydrolase family 2 TIM barrel-domain containing protein [Bacteroidales bacterium]